MRGAKQGAYLLHIQALMVLGLESARPLLDLLT